jgi:hypothetical protein
MTIVYPGHNDALEREFPDTFPNFIFNPGVSDCCGEIAVPFSTMPLCSAALCTSEATCWSGAIWLINGLRSRS